MSCRTTPLIDQDGKPLSMASLRGHRVALTFIYTRCPLPDFCPLMDKHFAAVQKTIKKTPDAGRRAPGVGHPRPGVRHAGGARRSMRRRSAPTRARWHFVTGDRRTRSLAFAKRFGVIAEPAKRAVDIVHNLRTAVIDPEGRLVKAYSGNDWTPAELVADLKAAPAPAR